MKSDNIVVVLLQEIESWIEYFTSQDKHLQINVNVAACLLYKPHYSQQRLGALLVWNRLKCGIIKFRDFNLVYKHQINTLLFLSLSHLSLGR